MLLFNILREIKKSVLVDFNTSNVTIQRFGEIFRRKRTYHFNTSNVTIQLLQSLKYLLFKNISIHLMLLFNIREAVIIGFMSKFQYI